MLKPQNSLLWYKTFIDWMDRGSRLRLSLLRLRQLADAPATNGIKP